MLFHRPWMPLPKTFIEKSLLQELFVEGIQLITKLKVDLKVGPINSHRLLTEVSSFIFLLSNRFYPVLFATCFGHVARYTPSTAYKNNSDKLQFYSKANFRTHLKGNPTKQTY